ncbi:hypothetical protein ACI2K4_23605 [Micromonospora sp. NPDC050397]|uniref:hypothetical protein n=1 Tax=Micromonospora sp. NPDC050397 TaxID=3364279 RepID=UPI00384F9686
MGVDTHRVRSRMALAGVVAVLCATVPAVGPVVGDPDRQAGRGVRVPGAFADPPDRAAGALPSRIGLPVIGTLYTGDLPRLGPAAVLFSGSGNGLTAGDEHGVVAVVGADADRYRKFEVGFDAPAGEQVVLSPDGRTVAYPAWGEDRGCVGLVDLTTGDRECRAGPASQSQLTVPLGWSGDGRRLVVREMVPVNPQRGGLEPVLSVIEVDGWVSRRLPSVPTVNGRPLSYDGYTVAFAPDQRRLAYQMSGTVTVADLDGRPISSFALAPGSRLAGKGAWTPDGHALTVAEARDDGAATLRAVDPGSGVPVGGPVLPAVASVSAIRLLGWHPDGSAVAVAYYPEPATAKTGYTAVRTVRVLALAPAAAAPTILLTAPDQVLAIDVADDVVAGGRIRVADPPSGPGGWFWFWACVAGATLLVVVLARLLRRPHHWSEV